MAESLLRQGAVTASEGHFCSVEALSVLYKLACSSESAADSLKMLHELQTLQIELDLQREQNEINASEIEAELNRYKALYNFAPVGYLVIDREGGIVESNPASAALLGCGDMELDGQRLDNFLAPASRPLFNWQLKKLFSGSSAEACALQTVQVSDGSRGAMLRVCSNLGPEGDLVFMTLSRQEGPPDA